MAASKYKSLLSFTVFNSLTVVTEGPQKEKAQRGAMSEIESRDRTRAYSLFFLIKKKAMHVSFIRRTINGQERLLILFLI